MNLFGLIYELFLLVVLIIFVFTKADIRLVIEMSALYIVAAVRNMMIAYKE